MKLKRLLSSILLPLALASLFAMPAGAAGPTAPVAKLQDIEGVVEYSKNGKRWKRVTRNKYLFPGYQVRTSRSAQASVLNHSTGETQELSERSEVKVTEAGVELVRGRLGEPEEEVSSFWQALVNKFSKAQRYTTVRRSVIEPCKVSTARDLTASSRYPELVWMNAGPHCSYRLQLAGQSYDIPIASTAEMVRFPVPKGLSAGVHEFVVEVVQSGEVVYKQRRPSKLKWLSDRESETLHSQEMELRRQTQDDPVALAVFLQDQGYLVQAMDQYRSYMMENPDDNDMRPLLIQSYQALKLMDLRHNEAVAYNAALADEADES